MIGTSIDYRYSIANRLAFFLLLFMTVILSFCLITFQCIVWCTDVKRSVRISLVHNTGHCVCIVVGGKQTKQ